MGVFSEYVLIVRGDSLPGIRQRLPCPTRGFLRSVPALASKPLRHKSLAKGRQTLSIFAVAAKTRIWTPR